MVVAAPIEAQAVVRGLLSAGEPAREMIADEEAGGAGAPHGLATRIDWRARPMTDRFDLLLCGVGKANAAAAVGRAMVTARHGGVLSIGLGGGLAGSDVGDIVVASESVLADDGAERPGGWESSAAFGFPAAADIDESVALAAGGMGVRCDERLTASARAVAEAAVLAGGGRGSVYVGGVATVSTCSGTDRHASAVLERTGAAAEAMEGAAVGLTAKRLHATCLFGEVRLISNRTGDDAGWDLPGSLALLEAVAARL